MTRVHAVLLGVELINILYSIENKVSVAIFDLYITTIKTDYSPAKSIQKTDETQTLH